MITTSSVLRPRYSKAEVYTRGVIHMSPTPGQLDLLVDFKAALRKDNLDDLKQILDNGFDLVRAFNEASSPLLHGGLFNDEHNRFICVAYLIKTHKLPPHIMKPGAAATPPICTICGRMNDQRSHILKVILEFELENDIDIMYTVQKTLLNSKLPYFYLPDRFRIQYDKLKKEALDARDQRLDIQKIARAPNTAPNEHTSIFSSLLATLFGRSPRCGPNSSQTQMKRIKPTTPKME